MDYSQYSKLSRGVQLAVMLDIQNWLIMNDLLTEELIIDCDTRLPKGANLGKYVAKILSVYPEEHFQQRVLDKVRYFIGNEYPRPRW